MLQKLGRIVCVVLVECLYKMPYGVLIDDGILIEFLTDAPGVFQAGRRNEFHIDLDPLSRSLHLLVRLWNIFKVGWMYSHDALFAKETI